MCDSGTHNAANSEQLKKKKETSLKKSKKIEIQEFPKEVLFPDQDLSPEDWFREHVG